MNKKDIKPYNDKGKPHGLWEWYYSDGSVWSKGFYNNGKEVGYEEFYLNKNDKLNKKYYI